MYLSPPKVRRLTISSRICSRSFSDGLVPARRQYCLNSFSRSIGTTNANLVVELSCVSGLIICIFLALLPKVCIIEQNGQQSENVPVNFEPWPVMKTRQERELMECMRLALRITYSINQAASLLQMPPQTFAKRAKRFGLIRYNSRRPKKLIPYAGAEQ